MRFAQAGNHLHIPLLYAAYGWLLFSGTLQFPIDVVGQCARRKRPPGAATTLYYGLNSAYALSQILFAALALLALSRGLIILGRWPGLTLGFLAASSWLGICVLFLEYRQPRMTVALFAALLAAAALTSKAP
jgi:hypothetical protein